MAIIYQIHRIEVWNLTLASLKSDLCQTAGLSFCSMISKVCLLIGFVKKKSIILSYFLNHSQANLSSLSNVVGSTTEHIQTGRFIKAPFGYSVLVEPHSQHTNPSLPKSCNCSSHLSSILGPNFVHTHGSMGRSQTFWSGSISSLSVWPCYFSFTLQVPLPFCHFHLR